MLGKHGRQRLAQRVFDVPAEFAKTGCIANQHRWWSPSSAVRFARNNGRHLARNERDEEGLALTWASLVEGPGDDDLHAARRGGVSERMLGYQLPGRVQAGGPGGRVLGRVSISPLIYKTRARKQDPRGFRRRGCCDQRVHAPHHADAGRSVQTVAVAALRDPG